MDNNYLTREKLSLLIDEVKNLEGSALVELTQEKINLMKETCASMPVYDNESMAKREFFRGVVNGLEWITKDVYSFIDREDKLLQRK